MADTSEDLDGYDPDGASPQVAVDLVQVAEGLKLQMWINKAGLQALQSGPGLSLVAGDELIVGEVEVIPARPTANTALVRLELNTGR